MIIRPKILDGSLIVEDNNGQRIIRQLTVHQLESLVRYQEKQRHSPGWGVFDGMTIPSPSPASGLYPYWRNFYNFLTGCLIVHYDKNKDYTCLYNTVGVNYPKIRVTINNIEDIEDLMGNVIDPEDVTYKIGLFTRQVITPAQVTA